MATLRLESGVSISTDNPSLIQQYLKYGAVEVLEDKKEEVEKPVKTTKKKKEEV